MAYFLGDKMFYQNIYETSHSVLLSLACSFLLY